jgi:hypothetical protein
MVDDERAYLAYSPNRDQDGRPCASPTISRKVAYRPFEAILSALIAFKRGVSEQPYAPWYRITSAG